MKLLLHMAIVAFALGASGAAFAQTFPDETRLKQYFEGKQVVVKIDLPATKDGVNVYPERAQAMDYGEYASRLKRYGVSVRAGDSIMITKIKVKNKHIEFQLGGGGYGTFGDDTSSSVYVPSVEKSRRERRLERELKDETDPRRRRAMREELDDLRREREREDRRNQAIAAEAEEAKKARLEQKALQGGARFNIRFDAPVPPTLTPGTLIKVLEKYVDFTDIGDRYSNYLLAPDRTASPTVFLKRGLSVAEVIAFLGEPQGRFVHTEGQTQIATYVFARKAGRIIEADFVGGALVSSRSLQREEPGRALTASGV